MIRQFILRWRIQALRDRAEMLDAYARGALREAEDNRARAWLLTHELNTITGLRAIERF